MTKHYKSDDFVFDPTDEAFEHAWVRIDTAFGSGFAMKNPELVGSFMIAEALFAVVDAISKKRRPASNELPF